MENINSWLTIPNDLSLTIKLKNFYLVSTQNIPVSGTKTGVSISNLQKPLEYFRHCSKVVEFFFKNADKMHTRVLLLWLRKREQFSVVIRLFTNEKGILFGKKLNPRLFQGLLLGSRRSAIGQSFSLSLVTIPELFAKVNSAEFPSSFVSPV